MDSREHLVPSGTETLACSFDPSEHDQGPVTICIPGLGPSDRHATAYLTPVFRGLGQSVVRFDPSGQGGSSGQLGSSSLKKRYDETKDVLAHFALPQVETIVGTSVGGYLAALLAEEFAVSNLVLFYPAAYSVRAWGCRFDEAFSEIIRTPQSYRESDVVAVLRRFRGNALLISGSHDDVIPKEVTDLYREGLATCGRLATLTLEGCPHPVHRWVEKHPDARRVVQNALAEFLAP